MAYLFLRTVWKDNPYEGRIWTNTNVEYALRAGVLNPGTIFQRYERDEKKSYREYYMVSGKGGTRQELIDVPSEYISRERV